MINHVSKYLDYDNCKSRNSLVHKLVEESEADEEVKLAEITLTEDENKP